MTYVEIETGERLDGNGWGYVIHYYAALRPFEYAGSSEARGRYGTEEEARGAAKAELDMDYGKRGWRHI